MTFTLFASPAKSCATQVLPPTLHTQFLQPDAIGWETRSLSSRLSDNTNHQRQELLLVIQTLCNCHTSFAIQNWHLSLVIPTNFNLFCACHVNILIKSTVSKVIFLDAFLYFVFLPKMLLIMFSIYFLAPGVLRVQWFWDVLYTACKQFSTQNSVTSNGLTDEMFPRPKIYRTPTWQQANRQRLERSASFKKALGNHHQSAFHPIQDFFSAIWAASYWCKCHIALVMRRKNLTQPLKTLRFQSSPADLVLPHGWWSAPSVAMGKYSNHFPKPRYVSRKFRSWGHAEL